MHKEYEIIGLQSTDHIEEIKNAIGALDGVADAVVGEYGATLRVEADRAARGDLCAEIEQIVRRYEPDSVVIAPHAAAEQSHGGHSHGGDEENQLARLLLGAGLFAVGMFLDRIVDLHAHWRLGLFLASYLILGFSVLKKAALNISRGQLFDENFLMSIATLGAFAIGDFAEAAGVMLFYQIGEFFQDEAVRRSKKSITGLMDIRPDYANVERGGELLRVAPDSVAIGERIVVKPGEKVPLDGVIVEGESLLDTSALTGESIPRKASVADTVLSGSINQSGLLTVKVAKPFGESTVAKIIALVENAGSKKAPTENFITTFARYYTPAVVGLALLLALVPPLAVGEPWFKWIQRGLIFLVISCPCALVISIPLSFFGGIGGASRKGILVKGGNYLEALNNLDIVVFDKTGTLTKGVFRVVEIAPAEGFADEDALRYAAQAEVFSNHPIAVSILKTHHQPVDKEQLRDYREISGHGISVVQNGVEILAGNEKLMRLKNVPFLEHDGIGTKVYVAAGGRYVGSILISDEIKPDSYEAIVGLKERGVRKTVMLTGDNAAIGEAIAGTLKLDEVYSQLLPDQKVAEIERIDAQKRPRGKLAFVGDGVNDAPVLARADIGIAMGNLGSDAAIEAADIVLMTDEPSKLLTAIDIAQKTKKVVWQNIVFALGVKAVFLVLGALGIATMWEAVFADVGVTVLAVLNAMRLLRRR